MLLFNQKRAFHLKQKRKYDGLMVGAVLPWAVISATQNRGISIGTYSLTALMFFAAFMLYAEAFRALSYCRKFISSVKVRRIYAY